MESPDASGSVSADNALPPVVEPSAGFLVQLFVVPAIIVSIIVVVFLLFHWLANKDNDPHKLAASLKQPSHQRWQSASTLADLLNNPQGDATRDAVLLQELLSTLKEELNRGDGWSDQEDILFKGYLCKAIGQFELPEATSGLALAVELPAGKTNVGAEDRASDAVVRVRRAALEAMAVAISRIPADKQTGDNDPLPSLLAASRDSQPAIRSPAAFALGALGTPPALKRLEQLANDESPNVRFNAATGLARAGSTAGHEVLVEMLTSQALTGFETENDVPLRQIAALNALNQMIKKLPGGSSNAELKGVSSAITQLLNDPQTPEPIRLAAKEVRQQLTAAKTAQ